QRAAAGLHELLHGPEDRAGLAGEIAGMRRAAVGRVGHLAGQKQDRLGARHLDGLAVAGRVEDAGGAILFELRHVSRPLWRPAAGRTDRTAYGEAPARARP